MEPMYYIGLDVHKQKISYCVKDPSGKLHAEGWIPATQLPMLPLICFETGRQTQTQSCWAARRAVPANGCLVLFSNRNRGREANTTR